MHKYKFHYVALSKTWLKSNKTQLEYIKTGGYISEFKNRVLRCQGRAGFYSRHHLEKLMNHLRFSGLSIKIEARTRKFL